MRISCTTAQLVKNMPAMQETPVRFLGQEDPLEKGQATHLGFLSDSDGKESTCSVGDLSSILELGKYLEEGMATHSSTLAWRIPRTEEPDGLQSMGLQRVTKHNTARSTSKDY